MYIKLKKDILTNIKSHNYYQALCSILFFIVLEKKQPLINNDLNLQVENYRSISLIIGVTTLFLISLIFM